MGGGGAVAKMVKASNRQERPDLNLRTLDRRPPTATEVNYYWQKEEWAGEQHRATHWGSSRQMEPRVQTKEEERTQYTAKATLPVGDERILPTPTPRPPGETGNTQPQHKPLQYWPEKSNASAEDTRRDGKKENKNKKKTISVFLHFYWKEVFVAGLLCSPSFRSSTFWTFNLCEKGFSTRPLLKIIH